MDVDFSRIIEINVENLIQVEILFKLRRMKTSNIEEGLDNLSLKYDSDYLSWGVLDIYEKDTRMIDLQLKNFKLKFFEHPFLDPKSSPKNYWLEVSTEKDFTVDSVEIFRNSDDEDEETCRSNNKFLRKMNKHYTQMRYTKFTPGEVTGKYISKSPEASLRISKLIDFCSDLYVDFKIQIQGQ